MQKQSKTDSKDRGRITVYIGTSNVKYINKLLQSEEYSSMSEIVREALRNHRKMEESGSG